MENFSFVDIFASKGVEYLIVIGFLITLVVFWKLLGKQKKATKQIQKILGILSANILRIPQGLFYSKNHTWAHLEKSGVAKVGLDDLLQHLTGEVKFSKLKTPGDIIKKGDLLTEIEKNGKKLKVFAPISGKILNTNSILNESPEILNEEPYNEGWVYRIKPSNWIAETKSYYLADDATNWVTKELERFKDFLAVSMKKHSPDPTMITFQDGGELVDNTLSELPDEVWSDFQKEFLN